MIQAKETQVFMEKLYRFNKLVHHQVADVTECPQSEYKMLGVIQRELDRQNKEQLDLPGVPISRLNEVLLHSKPATSRILRTLEEKNCITRIPSKTDRRIVYVTITEVGLKISKEIEVQVEEYMSRILISLGEEDTTQLLRLMDRLYDVVADMAKKKDKCKYTEKED